jgi:hypothetical protein
MYKPESGSTKGIIPLSKALRGDAVMTPKSESRKLRTRAARWVTLEHPMI